MSFVVTIEDVSPAPRFDATPWTQGRVEESAASEGPWTVLETIALDPLDADPAEPRSRSFTTTLGTLEAGFYRIVFLDTDLNEQASDPFYSQPIGTAYTSVSAVRDALAPEDQQGATGGTAASLPDHQIQDAIVEAANEINARLAARYQLPLSVPVPQLVETLNRDIAAYKATLTYRRNKAIAQDDPVRLRYDGAQKMLADIGAGRMELPIVAGGNESSTTEVAVENLYEGDLFSADDFGIGPAETGVRWQAH